MEKVGPKQCSSDELKKVGVRLILDGSRLWLQCEQCGSRWSPDILSGGKLPDGYWKCQRGCNTDQRS